MRSGRVLVASCVFLAGTLLRPCPSPAAEEPRLRDYEVRLAAHRRELMQREAELTAARNELRGLKRRGQTLVEAATHDPVERALPSGPPPPAELGGRADDRTEAIIETLRSDLEIERENRSTVEQELQRVLADQRQSTFVEPLRQSLESANADILVLNQRVLADRREREMLEVAGERLQRELRDANETIVSLRARLESLTASSNDPAELRRIEAENAKLRAALAATEQQNADLRAQAALASQLAEMLYAEPR